ncbi:hypothetical protein SAY86_000577 [Trapa natans]|uniref:ABC-2 type transporter transmembrane domain-containing protein n=1 Tax=Trapa natans TaxID=22666 RepID=A0AAN7MB63_TRANT|nr:hypothetical protein SAY86_000577 [Trapa natans]
MCQQGQDFQSHQCTDVLALGHPGHPGQVDRLGLLFFIAIFTKERAVRASGMYCLSSHFMARVVGEMTMELILPTIFPSVAYWMAGLRAELGAFLLTLLALLGYVLVSQGLRLFLGAAIMDAKNASTVVTVTVTVTMLALVLTGGFYVHKVPSGLSWIKYLWTTFYVLTLHSGGLGLETGDLLASSWEWHFVY